MARCSPAAKRDDRLRWPKGDIGDCQSGTYLETVTRERSLPMRSIRLAILPAIAMLSVTAIPA